MARTVKDVRLDSRAARERLTPRKKPYYRVIETGKAIGYYRGARGGSWLGRTMVDGRYVEKKLGLADDVRDANEIDVLSFSAAQAAARAWFDQLARETPGARAGPYRLADACDDYLADYIARGGKDVATATGRLNRIKLALGELDVAKLNAQQIKAWHREIATSGALTRSIAIDDSTGKRRVKALDVADDDLMRRRRATANRMLTVLKAALNYAFQLPQSGMASRGKGAWEAVPPLKGADAPKIRYLTDDESVRLINAAPADFRDLLSAALVTGCRYGELCALRARALDATANALRIETSKSGASRSVALTDEGVALFARLAKGKSANDRLLVREDGTPWLASHQLRRMKAVCAAAKIEPAISFHILRHTYGSRLAMRGAPMPVIAAQLGHTGTRMTERHYAHLGPSYVSTVVRELLGTIGLPPSNDNVVAIGATRR